MYLWGGGGGTRELEFPEPFSFTSLGKGFRLNWRDIGGHDLLSPPLKIILLTAQMFAERVTVGGKGVNRPTLPSKLCLIALACRWKWRGNEEVPPTSLKHAL